MRADKNNKPYFVCDSCGTQYFVRGKQGITKLTQIFATLKKNDLVLREHSRSVFEIRAICDELDELECELQKHEPGLLAKDTKEKKRARALIKQRMSNLLDKLADLIKL